MFFFGKNCGQTDDYSTGDTPANQPTKKNLRHFFQKFPFGYHLFSIPNKTDLDNHQRTTATSVFFGSLIIDGKKNGKESFIFDVEE